MNALRFRFSLLAWTMVAGAVALASGSDVGKRLPSEARVIEDAVTGFPIHVVTTAPANDSKIYQTHPQWTSDGKYIVFRSNRAANGKSQAYAVNEATGDIVQLTDGPATATSSLNLARKSNRLYFIRGERGTSKTLIELDLERLLADSEGGNVKAAESYERTVVALPDDMRESGGFALDADEKLAYLGMRFLTAEEREGKPPKPRGKGEPIPQLPSGIRSIDLRTGEIKTVVNTPFTMGHVQANPWIPGEIVYCKETGGDTDQRIWFVKGDGTGNRPLYSENPDEWVTHETFVGKDEVMFVILGHEERLRKKPTGIAVVNLRNNQLRLLGQAENGRGFWHCNGSPDGRWAAADTFEGSVYLIDRKTGEILLLTTGHQMRPDHAHPTFSPDSTRVIIQSGLLSEGKCLDIMVIAIPQKWLGARRAD